MREKEEAVAEDGAQAITEYKVGPEYTADLVIKGELKEKDPQVGTREYDTFANYYSNRTALGELEFPIEDASAQTSPPHTQEVEAETSSTVPTSEAVEAYYDAMEETSPEVETAQGAPQPEAEPTLD
ncbi:hypothetical protein CRG98_039688 [Punica granatum]|uniref:Uncharacterized protein n=1 Tax=Punica granatum TaxID=22663 RepID=A0A2I0I7H1_PUNGR|nr:hypothetical protein CRG98_039688 [Punica granatum]